VTVAIAVERAQVSKLGKDLVSATYVSKASCPTACALNNGNGCYADYGRVALTTTRLGRDSETDPLAIAHDEASAIDGLTGQLPLRLHVVGDCATCDAARAVSAAAGRHRAKFGRPVWTYTHAWRDVPRDAWGDVSVLASCETELDVIDARERGYATAIVTDEHPADGRAYASAGGITIPCPEQTRARVCASCRLCWDDQALRARNATIAFAVHGSGIRKAKAAIAAAHQSQNEEEYLP